MLRLFLAVTPAALVLSVAIFVLMTVNGFACQMVTASWYGTESGNRTADGSYFDGSQMYAASRSMAFGTKLRLTYRGRSAIVVVRDRGPYVKGRSLDISSAAADQIGLKQAGVGRVCAEQIR